MTCRDFERLWNELIDAGVERRIGRPAASVSRAAASEAASDHGIVDHENALLEHSARCPACGQVSAKYQTLRRAIREWGLPPVPSAGLTERILAEIQKPAPSAAAVFGETGRENWRPLIATVLSAVAASLLVAIFLGQYIRTLSRGRQAVLHPTSVDSAPGKGFGSETVAVDSLALNHAVSEATAATWDLAWSASEPAARISRQMLDAATGPDRNPAQPVSTTGSEPIAATVSVPSFDSLTPDTAAAGAMLQQVGDRLATGVRPLSDTARHAFGFLLGPALPKPEVPINLPAQKGA